MRPFGLSSLADLLSRAPRVALASCLALALLATGASAWRPAWWPGMVAAALAAGALLVAVWRRRQTFSAKHVLVGALVLRAAFVVLPPVLSDDSFRYVWDGRVQVEARTNPFRYAPEDAALAEMRDAPPERAFYERLNSKRYHSVYPPASQWIFAAGALVSGGRGWLPSFYLINALFALMDVALVVLLYRQGVGAGALALYALHPLVLLEAAGQGHTEAGAALCLVGAVACARGGRGRVASALVAGATLFKLYPLVLFPFLWRRYGWGGLWPGALLGAFAAGPYVLPELSPLSGGVAWAETWASLELYVRLFEFNAGPYFALKETFRLFTGADWSKALGPALRWVFLAGLPVLYGLDARRRWPLAKAFVWTVAFYLLCATTVHPWYLLPLLALAALRPRPAWPWLWTALCAVGTYLFYAPVAAAEGWYWAFVVLGWGGALVLAVAQTPRAYAERLVRPLLRRRAEGKACRVAERLPPSEAGAPPLRVLDLGAGEGFVGASLRQQAGAEVVLADVGHFNQTDLPYHVYDGRRLPFEDDAFDVVVLYFVLHHTEDAEAVLAEALRVARRRVVVAESVFESEAQRRLLRVLDRQANRLRLGGAMDAGPLRFRRAGAWRALAERLGATVLREQRRGHWVHRQAFFTLAPRGRRDG